MAAYLKDVENNTRDMTADTIIKEKMNRIETKDVGTQKFNICINRNTLKKKKIIKENIHHRWRISIVYLQPRQKHSLDSKVKINRWDVRRIKSIAL